MDNELDNASDELDNASEMPADLPWQLLEEITNGFSEERKIGSGGYGAVYKGVYKNGEEIAVKKLYHMPGLDDKQFQNELQNLTRLRHENIVRLVGKSYEERDTFVEYKGKLVCAKMIDRVICLEYLHNGSLEKHLCDESSGLPWHRRYEIIKGICDGLAYLHGCRIFHLDLKPANILLDKNMVPKIADFGLSRLFSGPRQSHTTSKFLGTLGYVPPEYIEKFKISEKFDVFSLGVIIIGIMTGPDGYSKHSEMSSQDFIEQVLKNWRNRPQEQWKDKSYLDVFCQQVKICIEIALNCVETDRHKRPSIGDIICKLDESETMIEKLYKGLDQPRSGILQQKSFMQSPQQFHQLQFPTPQQQQQLLMQAQQNMASPTASDVDTRRLRMFLNNRNMALGRDGKTNSVGDIIPNMQSPQQFIGLQGSNQDGNNLTLKGRPLTGLEQLWARILQQESFMQNQQQQQVQFLTQQQQQQQLMLQAQQNMASPTSSDVDSRRMRMMLNNRNVVLGRDGRTNSGGDIIPNIGSPSQSGGDIDMLIKKKLAHVHQQQQQQLLQQQSNSQQQPQQQHQLQQPAVSSQQSQSSNQFLQQEKPGIGSMPVEGSMPNSFGGADQTTKKRKKPGSSSGRANSSGTANTTGPSPSSAPSTPSTHTPGDAMSVPQLQQNGGSAKPLVMFGSDGTGSLTSPANPLGDVDRLLEEGSLDENVESFLSQDDMDPRDTLGRCMDASKGFGFAEIAEARASATKVSCCHFSSDGKLLATGGHDKKVVLWCTEPLKPKSSLEEHSSFITDVRFSLSMSRLATSSFDKTVRVWDADNTDYSLRTFTGHSASVTSLDFHPNKEDMICSLDTDGEVRSWSINNGSCLSCVKVSKGGATQMRFQPRKGKYLAAASEKTLYILDGETQHACRNPLQGHTKNILSVCWDSAGDYLASVSEDSVRIWSFTSGHDGESAHELNCSGNKFQSCVFHPSYPSLLVIGCYQSLELWDIREKNSMTFNNAHDGLIAALAASSATGKVASVSHDRLVKLWK